MKVEILEARVSFIEQPFIQPLQLSSGAITVITEARAEVEIHIDGKRANGRGSIYLSDLWAWPDPTKSHDERDAVLRDVCLRICGRLPELCGEPGHPLQLGLTLHQNVCHGALADGLPVLALAMCASPFDAAIHDAAGIALKKSAFDFYGTPCPVPAVDPFFPETGACEAISKVIAKPLKKLDAWLIVSKGDSLENDVAPWVSDRGYHGFKIKTAGRDNREDARRVVEVFRAVKEFGVEQPRLTVDSNEGNPDADSVLDFLERLEGTDSSAYAALEYLEQPTGRDITQCKYDWPQVTRRKPVLLDEGLTSLELLDEAKQQGWSGLALKTCKGHSFALAAAAWARGNGMMLALQDLTNPGFSAIHAALFAAHVHAVNGVELNSPQYTPDANKDWLPRLKSLFEPRDGFHRLPENIPAGLGSTL